MRETETDTQSIMGRGQGLEGWSSCWEEKADILEKPRQLSVLVSKGQEGPITQISHSEISPAGFALNGRGKLGSHALALTPPKPSGYVPLALSRRPGDACFGVLYVGTGGAQNLQSKDSELEGRTGKGRGTTSQVTGRELRANQSHP